MIARLANLAPLAERSTWYHLGDRFSGENLQLQSEDVVGAVLLVAVSTLVLGGLAWLSGRKQRAATKPNPRRLFHELCDMHRLSDRDQRLLKALARGRKLASPAELFVRPELFAEPKNAIDGVAPKPLAALRVRLFGDAV